MKIIDLSFYLMLIKVKKLKVMHFYLRAVIQKVFIKILFKTFLICNLIKIIKNKIMNNLILNKNQKQMFLLLVNNNQ